MSFQTTPPIRAAPSTAVRISDPDKSTWTDGVPKIVVTGLKRSGKSSILRVLFNKLPPHEAMYIDATQQPTFLELAGNPLLNSHIAEIPGNWTWDDSEGMDQLFFSQCQSLILVVDASSSDDVSSAVYSHSKRVIARALRVNPKIHIHLFLNKIDANYRFDPDTANSETNKANFTQAVVGRISEDVKTILGANRLPAGLALTTHCTSIFDNSIHDAFSKVIQQPLLANGKIEQMMDLILTTCRLEKAVLFDIVSKIALATDSGRQSDPSTVALMRDMLDVVLDLYRIYHTDLDTENEPTSCHIRLSNQEVLYMKMIGKNLALVSIIKADNFDKTFLLNHNLNAFSGALLKVAHAMA
jgi:Ras-related GTP-binding protein C/D